MATRSRPAQGVNRNPRKPPRAAYVPEPAPKVVSQGTVSKPKKPAAWRPGTLPKNATPKIVQA
jgi:hypothetical protein